MSKLRLPMTVLRAPKAAKTRDIKSFDKLPPVVKTGKASRSRPEPELDYKDVEIRQYDPTIAEAEDIARDGRTLAQAFTMPVSLIRPTATGDATVATGPEAWGISAVGASHAGTDAGRGVVVAVLDTGIDAAHPAFQGVDITPRNFTNDVDEDTDGHGTHCAGTIFGRDVDGMRIGVARGIEKALIGKVIGGTGGSTDQIYKAMQWALLNGAHVISMSLGIDFPGFQKELQEDFDLEPEYATSIALAGYRANIRLFDRIGGLVTLNEDISGGSIVVAAAGNESDRPDYAITVSPPAAGEGFLSVAALGQTNDTDEPYQIARFSNNEARIAGPGVDIVSARSGGGLHSMNGTSMATPHVAGVAALWAQGPVSRGDFQASEVIRDLEDGALPLPWISTDDTRHGLARAPHAGS